MTHAEAMETDWVKALSCPLDECKIIDLPQEFAIEHLTKYHNFIWRAATETYWWEKSRYETEGT